MRNIFIVCTLAISLIGCSSADDLSQETTNESQTSVTEKPSSVGYGMMPSVVTKDESKDSVVANEKGEEPQYIDFSDQLYSSMLGKKPFALFFHAKWCPTCRQMEKDIKADLKSFPRGTVILKADFDTQTALEKKYGIVSQSFIVILNKNGEAVSQLWAPNNNALKDAINKSL